MDKEIQSDNSARIVGVLKPIVAVFDSMIMGFVCFVGFAVGVVIFVGVADIILLGLIALLL